MLELSVLSPVDIQGTGSASVSNPPFKFWGQKNHALRKMFGVPALCSLLVVSLTIGYADLLTQAVLYPLSLSILGVIPLAYSILRLRTRQREASSYACLHPTRFLGEERDLQRAKFVPYLIIALSATAVFLPALGVRLPTVLLLLAAIATFFGMATIVSFLPFSFATLDPRMLAVACLRSEFDGEREENDTWLDDSTRYISSLMASEGMKLRIREEFSLRSAYIDTPSERQSAIARLVEHLEAKGDEAGLRDLAVSIGRPSSEILEKVSLRIEIERALRNWGPIAGTIYTLAQLLLLLIAIK